MTAQEKDEFIHIEKGVLKIREVHPRHSGDYECLVDNPHGSATAKFQLNVRRKSSTFVAKLKLHSNRFI